MAKNTTMSQCEFETGCIIKGTSLVAQLVKTLPEVQETQVQFLGQEDPWRRKGQPTPVFLPRESYGQWSLAGYSP